MAQKMLCLIGEQPVPNLLPIRELRPKEVVLFYTTLTEERSKYLRSVLINEGIICERVKVDDPYHIEDIVAIIGDEVDSYKSGCLLNLTGGTKPMAFAGFEVSREKNIPFCYLQSEGKRNLLFFYSWNGDSNLQANDVRKMRDDLITIDDYLKTQLGDYHRWNNWNDFEQSAYETLNPHVTEITHSIRRGGSLEIDLIFRCGNSIGIAELKTGKSATEKEGIDQLNAACAREYLGTYTKKFLIIDRKYPPNNKELARAWNINVIELMESKDKGYVVDADKEKLVRAVTGVLGEK